MIDPVIGSPELKVVIELTGRELVQPSGVFETDGTKELSNWQFIEMYERAMGSQGVSLNSNGRLSPESKDHNIRMAQLGKLATENMKFAVISRRPPVT